MEKKRKRRAHRMLLEIAATILLPTAVQAQNIGWEGAGRLGVND